MNREKIKSSNIIKKLLKGFKVAKKFEHVYVKMRLTDNLAHFDDQKGYLKINAQILIAYHWRKKLADIRRKRLALKNKKTDESPIKGT